MFGGLSSRLIGLTALAAGAAWLLAVGLPMALDEDLTPFANLYALAFGGGALVSLATAYALWRNGDALHTEENVEFPLVLAGANILLGALFATQIDDPWFAAAWAAQGAAFVGLSFRVRWAVVAADRTGRARRGARCGCWPSACRWRWDENLTPFANLYALTFAMTAAAFFAASYVLWRYRDALHKEEEVTFPAVLAGANILLGALFGTQLDSPWFGAAWTAQGAAVVALSLVFGGLSARLIGLAALAAGAAWLLAVGLPMALDEDLTPFINLYAATFAIAAAASFAAAYALWLGRKTLRPEERIEFPLVLTGGNVLLAALFATQLGSPWLPVAWSVQALAMLWLWRVWGLWEMRWSGCALLALVVVRLVGWENRYRHGRVQGVYQRAYARVRLRHRRAVRSGCDHARTPERRLRAQARLHGPLCAGCRELSHALDTGG